MSADQPIQQSSILIYKEAGEWCVRVNGAGQQSYSQEFHSHVFAANNAEGQRIRLKLDKVEDPAPDDRMPTYAFETLTTNSGFDDSHSAPLTYEIPYATRRFPPRVYYGSPGRRL
jgi:hypothetical protein